MNIYEFMSGSPWLTYFLAFLAAKFLILAIKTPFRAINIRRHGWPPPHLDADGDFKPEPEKEEEP